MHKLALAVFAFAALSSLSITGAEAKNRPTVDDGTGIDCFLDPDGDTDYGDTIVSCCYDDGCWICERSPGQNCVWDPKYRLIKPQRDLTISPGDMTPKPGKKLPRFEALGVSRLH
jgi:hypothetical protein